MSEGVQKILTISKETGGWGVKPGAGTGRKYRRVNSTFQLEKDAFESAEINESQQLSDMRHGTRRSSGNLDGELAGSSYDELMAAVLRKDFVAGATTGAVIVISSTATTFSRSAGSFITDGFRIGRVVEVSGFADADNNGLFVITDLTASIMTRYPLQDQIPTVEAAGASITILEKGKKSFTPLTGHTRDSFCVEEFYQDTNISRIFLGEQPTTMALGLTPNAMVTAAFGFLGRDAETPTASQYFTAPAAVSGEGTFAGQDGIMIVNGLATEKVTSLNINLDGGVSQIPALGTNRMAARSRSKLRASVEGTAIFDDTDFLSYFDEEQEVSLTYVLRTADRSDAFAIHFPRLKVGSATTDDGEKNVILSFTGSGLEYKGANTAQEKTTVMIQDTTLV